MALATANMRANSCRLAGENYLKQRRQLFPGAKEPRVVFRIIRTGFVGGLETC